MGQASSSRRKPQKTDQNTDESLSDGIKNQVLEIYSNTDKDAEENEVSLADFNNLQKDDEKHSHYQTCNKHICKYELVRAASTSAKIRPRDTLQRNYRLSMQTFQGEMVEPIISDYKRSESIQNANVEGLFTVVDTSPKSWIRPEFQKNEKFQIPPEHTQLASTRIEKGSGCFCTVPHSKKTKDDNCEICSSLSKSYRVNKNQLMVEEPIRAIGVKEKSIMCDIQDCVQNRGFESSSVVLLPSPSQPQLAKAQWEAIVPKLLSMPSNKVLYVVEIKSSKQTQSCYELNDCKILKGNYLPTMEEKYEIGSKKILKFIEYKYKVRLKTLNDLLRATPKQLLLFLTKGVLPQSNVCGSPLRIPLNYSTFANFFSSGV